MTIPCRSRVGPTTPTRARRLADASVDPTEARKLALKQSDQHPVADSSGACGAIEDLSQSDRHLTVSISDHHRNSPDGARAWVGCGARERIGRPRPPATESLQAAREASLIPGTDKRIKSGQKLSREHFDAQLPVVRRRLCQAGLRLAMVLN
jgi:hypothetical protein